MLQIRFVCFSQFNFVGKLLGPRGNSLKRLQEETLTKMSILGKGSMRDKAKVMFVIDSGCVFGRCIDHLSYQYTLRES